nr:HepT-like ribonuclease domain-containing protein [Bacteroides salyersiae]
MSLLDGICMKLIAVGESIKNLDKITNNQLLPRYPHIPWREIMGMRDIIVHHYFEIDADVILITVQDGIPSLLATIKIMAQEL